MQDTCKIFAPNPLVKNVLKLQTFPTTYLNSSINTLPANQYTKMIGFFCKKELELEKALKVPVRFRLGSVAYTDKMENKNTFRTSAALKN
jgi:hypothetical protein